MFFTAQKEIELRSSKRVRHKKHEHYMLSDKLYCGECGSKMHGLSGTSNNGTVHRYYGCPNNRGKKKICPTHQVRADHLENLIIEETRMCLLNPEKVKVIASKVYQYQLKAREDNTQIKLLESQLKENEKALGNLIKVAESGIITESIPARIKELEQIRSNLIRDLKTEKAADTLITEEQLIFLLTREWNNEPLIQSLIQKVFLYNDKIVIIYNLTDPEGSYEKTERKFDTNRPCSTIDLQGRTLVISSECVGLVVSVAK